MKRRQINAVAALLMAVILMACAREGGQAAPQAAAEDTTGAAVRESEETAGGITASSDAGTNTPAVPKEDAGGADTGSEAVVLEEGEGDWQNPVMNFIGIYGKDRCTILVEARGSGNGAAISVFWAGSAAENSEWIMSGDLDLETLTVEYSDGVKTSYVYNEEGEVESSEEVYTGGKGRIIFSEGDLSLLWEDDEEHIADGTVFTYSSYGGAASQGINPWRDATEEEAARYCSRLFVIPAGASHVRWSIMDAGRSADEVMEAVIEGSMSSSQDAVEAQKAEEKMTDPALSEKLDAGSEMPAGTAGQVDVESMAAEEEAAQADPEKDTEMFQDPLIEASFELDGTGFTARAQQGAGEDEDISGMYYEWDAEEEFSPAGWGDGKMPGKVCAFFSEEEAAQMCTWYDRGAGIVYSLSTAGTPSSVDGLDITAVAGAMAPAAGD